MAQKLRTRHHCHNLPTLLSHGYIIVITVYLSSPTLTLALLTIQSVSKHLPVINIPIYIVLYSISPQSDRVQSISPRGRGPLSRGDGFYPKTIPTIF